MQMLYAYALTESPEPPAIAGLDGAPLQIVGDGRERLYGIASEHAEPPGSADPADLWAHEEVVEAAMAHGTVLPMRLGTVFSDEQALLDALRSRRRELRRTLDRVAGAVELGVRAELAADEHDAEKPAGSSGRGGPGPGTAYMLSQLERAKKGRNIAAAIHEPLAELARESSWRLAGGDSRQLVAAYLVDREQVDSFRAKVEDLEKDRGIPVVCTGPWPPYSFVSWEDR